MSMKGTSVQLFANWFDFLELKCMFDDQTSARDVCILPTRAKTCQNPKECFQNTSLKMFVLSLDLVQYL